MDFITEILQNEYFLFVFTLLITVIIIFIFGRGRFRTKFGYYHLCSHMGDEYMLKHPAVEIGRASCRERV